MMSCVGFAGGIENQDLVDTLVSQHSTSKLEMAKAISKRTFEHHTGYSFQIKKRSRSSNDIRTGYDFTHTFMDKHTIGAGVEKDERIFFHLCKTCTRKNLNKN